jgi:hypothetical protein
VERVAWTDERLDDMSQRMDAGFERVDRDIRDLRFEMHGGFADVRSEMHAGFAELRSLMFRVGGGVIVSVLAAALLQGV